VHTVRVVPTLAVNNDCGFRGYTRQGWLGVRVVVDRLDLAVSPSLLPASSCSMRSFTLAAITSLAVCILEVEGREVTLLVSFVVAIMLMGWFLRFE
jgi:hypothetical protein